MSMVELDQPSAASGGESALNQVLRQAAYLHFYVVSGEKYT